MTAVKEIALACTEGGSDKVYYASIEQASAIGDAYLVLTSWGRRGGTLATGSKTPTGPVTRAMAEQILAKLEKEKRAGGYVPIGGPVPGLVGENTKVDSGLRPQLLNAVDDDGLPTLLTDPAYLMQPKMDGTRLMVRIDAGDRKITGVNRKGQEIPLPAEVAKALEPYLEMGVTVLDGELVGGKYYLFDLLWLGGRDLRQQAYVSRLSALIVVIAPGECLEVVPTAQTTVEKAATYTEFREAGAEGVVFKRADAPYTAGRPNSGGTQLKYKFWAEADAILMPNEREARSMGMWLYDRPNGNRGFVGNVTIGVNFPMPQANDVAKVRYLYAYRGGSLFQPQFEGVRDDKSTWECTIDQLKFKAEGPQDDDN